MLEGGYNHDTITGGPGRDVIYGDSTKAPVRLVQSCTIPFGNDTIDARDGEVDNIDCGVGEDKAIVDASTSSSNCETVDGQPGGAGAPAPGGPAAVANKAATTDAAKRSAKAATSPGATVVGARSVRALAAGRLKVAVPCAAACQVTVAVLQRGKTIASGSKTVLAAGNATATLKVKRAARKKVKRMRSAKLTLKITVKAGSGKPVTTTQPLSLSR